MGEGFPLHQLRHIVHALLQHQAALFIGLPLQVAPEQLQVAVQVKGLGQDIDLKIGRRDFQVGGKVFYGGALIHAGHGVEVDGKQL